MHYHSPTAIASGVCLKNTQNKHQNNTLDVEPVKQNICCYIVSIFVLHNSSIYKFKNSSKSTITLSTL